MRKKSNKTILVIVLILIIGFGLLGLGEIFSSPQEINSGQPNTDSGSTRNYVLNTCATDALVTFHIHPHLQIIINNKEQTVPADIGITPTCQRPIHTHDTSGTIHVESPIKMDFTLGDFFAVWHQPFSQNQILNYKTDANHGIVMTVDGQPSDEYENLILQDGRQIVIEYKTK